MPLHLRKLLFFARLNTESRTQLFKSNCQKVQHPSNAKIPFISIFIIKYTLPILFLNTLSSIFYISHSSIRESNKVSDGGAILNMYTSLDDKRKSWHSEYASSNGSLKANPEQDLDFKLKIAKEKYEERLEAITDKVKLIFDEIRKDEVIETMREDPTSNIFIAQRMREICEDNLSKEREETIDKLMTEVMNAQAELRKYEKEFVIVQQALRTTEDNLMEERARLDLKEQEMKDLKAKITQMNREFDETLKRKNEEAQNNFRTTIFEMEKLKEALEKAENDVWMKAAECDKLRKEQELSSTRIEQLESDLRNLKFEFNEKDLNHSSLQRAASDSEIINQELKTKLIKAGEELTKVKETLTNYEQEREELKAKYLQYGLKFKETLEGEQKNYVEKISSLNKKYKSKSSRLKKKIIEQRHLIQAYESELQEAKVIVEASKHGYEKSLTTVQEDLKRVRNEWEKRCRETEQECHSQVSELKHKQSAQISELQQHYQQLLEDKIREFQNEATHQIHRQKQLDSEFKKLLDEKMYQIEKDYIKKSKHEAEIQDEIARVKNLYKREMNDLQESHVQEISRKIREIKDEHKIAMDKYVAKLRTLEEENLELSSHKKHLENELDFSKERIESLNSRISALKSDISELENGKLQLTKSLEETSFNLTKLKNQFTEESMRREKLEADLQSERNKSKDYETKLKESEKDWENRIQMSNMSFQDQVTSLEEALRKEQASSKKIFEEASYMANVCKRLEREKSEAMEQLSKESHEYLNNTQRIKQEEYSKYEKEVEEHKESRRRLIQAESQMKYLSEELRSSENATRELKELCKQYEREIGDMRGKLSYLENTANSKDIENFSLLKELDKTREERSNFKSNSKKVLRKGLERIKQDLGTLSRSTFQEMISFKQNLQNQLVNILTAMQDHQRNVKKNQDLLLLQKDNLIRKTEEDKKQIQSDLNLTFNSKSKAYEAHIENLKDTVSQLKNEIGSKNEEIGTFLRKVQDMQKLHQSLEAENSRLENELKNTYESLEYYKQESIDVQNKLKHSLEVEIEDKRYEIEEFYKTELRRCKDIIEKIRTSSDAQLTKLQAQVSELQAKHKEEINRIAGKYETSLDQAEKDLHQENEKNRKQKSNFDVLKSQLDGVERKSEQMLSRYEQQIKELNEAILEDKQRMQRFRNDKLTEIEELNRKLRYIQSELELKNEIIEKLEKDKDELRNSLRESSSEIRGRLAKSYSSTLASMKKAEQLEQETRTLTRKARESSDSNKLPVSLHKLRSSLERFK